MMHPPENPPPRPWYREPWPWFIIAIIVISFSWGLFQLAVALRWGDTLVVDDYYQKGKAINIDLTRDDHARQWGISANLQIDGLSGEVRVQVTGRLQPLPDTLKLSLLSPLFADEDTRITLRRSVSGEYVGQLQQFTPGRYYLQLETLDQQVAEVGYTGGWRLSQKTEVAADTPIRLTYRDTGS